MKDHTERPRIPRASEEDHLPPCPNSSDQKTTYPAEKAWDSTTSTGQRIRYDTYKKHRHFWDKQKGQDCEYTGLSGVVTRKPKSNPEPKPE